MSEMIIMEVHFYLSSFIWGMVLVAIYDVLRIMRRIISHNYLWIALEDFLFWVIAALLIFNMSYPYNNGSIRLPGMITLFLGMILYHFLISNPFVGFLNKRIILPIKKGIRVLHRGLKKIVNKVKMKRNQESKTI